jgi:hypothetical protein
VKEGTAAEAGGERCVAGRSPLLIGRRGIFPVSDTVASDRAGSAVIADPHRAGRRRRAGTWDAAAAALVVVIGAGPVI